MKNTNFMASLKAFFSKAWTATKAFSIKAGKWVVANKLISIPVAVVLVGGIACAIALPIALHEHDFATEWSTDANNHWHSAICSHEEEKSDLGAHAYDNACDTTCNVCGATRTVGAHAYDNDCDTTCNTCGATRIVGAHAYDNDCDTTCNTCGATRTVGAHVYDNACDTTCNTCGATRTITHDHADTLTAGDTTHYYLCSVCGDKKDEVAHVFDKTVASSEYLKAAATATTKAQYYKSCVCGKASATEYFETDKTVGTLANIQDLSKTYDKVELANPTYETNSDGAVTVEWYQGDTKLDAKPVNAGTYKAKVIIAESATYTGISAEKEFTIAKVVVTIPTLEKEYDGYDEFEFVFEGPAGEEIDCLVEIGNKNAGTYTDVAITDKSVSSENYEITATTVNAKINKKVLSGLSVDLTYAGTNSFEVPLGSANGILADDVADGIKVCITFADKNAGAAVTGAGLDADDGDNYTNYELDLTTCTASIVPKTLNYLEITKVYDGEGVLAYALGTEHGVVAGDEVLFYCDEEPDYNVGTYNLIPENDPTSIDDPGADDRASLAGADKANYKFAERIEGKYKLCATITVTPKTINVTAEFEYSGISVRQIHAPAPSLSDVIDGDEVYIEIAFDKADVDATVLTGEDAPYLDGADCDNYTLGTYSFSIVPKKLTLKEGQTLSFTEDYRKNKAFTMNVDTAKFDGYVGTASQMTITVTTPSDHAGTYSTGVILSPYNGPHNVVESKNYDFSEIDNATFTIRKLDLYISMTVEYNGSTEFAFDNYLLTPANTDDGNGNRVYNGDVVYLDSFEVDSADITSEIFVYDYVLSGEDAENYYIDEFAVEITKKKLTNLEINVTEAVYNVPGVDGSETATLTLLVKDGIIPGETVEITVTNYAQADLWNGTFELCLKDPADLTQGQEIIALVASGNYANYELVADANGVVGTMTIVANCDVQYDGSCNCGTSHLTETLTFTGGEAVGASATIDCDSTYEGGIYKIALEGGEYEFSGSDQFFNISGIYDVNGNTLATSIGTYILPQGTYYFHVYVGTSPSSDTIWVKKTAKILDAATMANAIVPDMEPGNSDVGVRIHNLQTHNGGDTFVLFYNVGENADALGHEINFQYEDGDGGYSATSNIESIEFYDVNGIQLNVTYNEPDMIAASGVTAVGGVYIVVTMNGEGMDNLYFYAY